MQVNEMMSGFSNLLSEFKNRTRTPTEIEDLQLKFRTSHDFYLYTVEDGTEHLMMLAVYNPSRSQWTYFLISGTPARKLVEELCEEYGFTEVIDELDGGFERYKKSLKT